MTRLKLPQWCRYAFFGILTAATLHLSPFTSCSKDDDTTPDPVDESPILDVQQANRTADSVEAVFAAADVEAILGFMSGEGKARSGQDIRNASPELLQSFASDFDKRKLVGHGSRYIEYEFEWNGVPYTVAFALQEDGTFKIIRL